MKSFRINESRNLTRIRRQIEPLKVLKCNGEIQIPSDSYTFVIPEGFPWQVLGDSLEAGQSIKVSGSCNPNFKLDHSYSCDQIKSFEWCENNNVWNIVFYGTWNTNGILETMLQCPQCGCGAEGADNLNDLLAAESRTVVDDEPRKISDVHEIILNSQE